MKGSALLIVLMLALMGVAYGQECTDIVQALSDYGTCTSACVGDDGIDESCLCDCYIGVYDAFESCSEVCEYVGTSEFQEIAGQYLSECGQTQCDAYDNLCNLIENCDSSNEDGDNNPLDLDFWEGIVCWVTDVTGEDTCDVVDLVIALQEAAGAVIEPDLSEGCNNYENYCGDGGSSKRQDASRLRSVKVYAIGFSSAEEASASFAAVERALADGDLDDVGVTGVSEIACSDCGNECKDCELEGKWHRNMEMDCSSLDGCPSGEGDREIDIHAVLNFRGDDKLGETDDLTITQYWDFNGAGECTGTWSGKFRFYSDASQCRVRTLDIEDCDTSCESGVADGFRDMVCRSSNLVIDEEIDDASFNNNCNDVRFQDKTFEEGDGRSNDDDDDDDDSDSGASNAGVALFVAVLAILGYLF